MVGAVRNENLHSFAIFQAGGKFEHGGSRTGHPLDVLQAATLPTSEQQPRAPGSTTVSVSVVGPTSPFPDYKTGETAGVHIGANTPVAVTSIFASEPGQGDLTKQQLKSFNGDRINARGSSKADRLLRARGPAGNDGSSKGRTGVADRTSKSCPPAPIW